MSKLDDLMEFFEAHDIEFQETGGDGTHSIELTPSAPGYGNVQGDLGPECLITFSEDGETFLKIEIFNGETKKTWSDYGHEKESVD